MNKFARNQHTSFRKQNDGKTVSISRTKNAAPEKQIFFPSAKIRRADTRPPNGSPKKSTKQIPVPEWLARNRRPTDTRLKKAERLPVQAKKYPPRNARRAAD